MWLIFIECDPYSNSDIQSFKGSQLISIVTFKEHKILFSLIIFIYNYVIQKCRYLYEIPNNIKKVCLHINGKHKKHVHGKPQNMYMYILSLQKVSVCL